MGSDRRSDQKQPCAEIPELKWEEFGITREELHQLWKEYYQERLLGSGSPVTAANLVTAKGRFDAIQYLVALALEFLTACYFQKKEA